MPRAQDSRDNITPDAPPAAAMEARSLSLGSRNRSQNEAAPIAAAGGQRDNWKEIPDPALIPATKRKFSSELKKFCAERGLVFLLHRVSCILLDDPLTEPI